MLHWALASILIRLISASPETEVQTKCLDLFDAAREHGPGTAAWQTIEEWYKIQEIAASIPAEPPLQSLCARLGLVDQLLGPRMINLAMACPGLASLQLEAAANMSIQFGDFRRAQVLLQLGAPFRLMALSRVLFSPQRVREEKDAEGAISRRFHNTLQALRPFGPRLREWQRGDSVNGLRVKVMSLCDAGGGNFNGTAAPVTAENHRAWAAVHGYEYTMLLERPILDLEPQYSKVHIARDAIAVSDAPEWFVWLDCDTLVMNRSISVEMVLETYDAHEADLVIAEEPSGINSGVFFLRGSQSARQLMEVVNSSAWQMVWDQSMFLNGMVAQSDLFAAAGCSIGDLPDFEWPKGIRTVHQAAMNLYSAGSARQWGASAWEEGGFIMHMAGCPLSESECWERFESAAEWAREFGG
mmetsp:Transcript_121056/g.353763  ORF Transcript_121056/g.353763 Transcript_121056/m.353763 type:complete len:414 (+) Transcript_121056:166-1407(+)